MRDKTLVNIRHSLCQKQNPVERPAETIDAILSLRPIFWHKAANHFDNPHFLQNYGIMNLQNHRLSDTYRYAGYLAHPSEKLVVF